MQVELSEGGLSSLRVADDGSGIAAAHRMHVALPHYTSKLCQYDDLQTLRTYGFRGEGLSSLCLLASEVLPTPARTRLVCRVPDVSQPVSQMTIATRTHDEPSATLLHCAPDGSVRSVTDGSHIAELQRDGSSGTVVSVVGLFHATPVRRQLNQSRSKVSSKQVRELMTVYALAHPDVRFSLRQPPLPDFIKPPARDLLVRAISTTSTAAAVSLTLTCCCVSSKRSCSCTARALARCCSECSTWVTLAARRPGVPPRANRAALPATKTRRPPVSSTTMAAAMPSRTIASSSRVTCPSARHRRP